MDTNSTATSAPSGGWWHTHGTKILGGITAVVGAAGESLTLIQGADPKHAAMWGLVIGIAGAIVKRGFTNQEAIQASMLAKGWIPPQAPPSGPATEPKP